MVQGLSEFSQLLEFAGRIIPAVGSDDVQLTG